MSADLLRRAAMEMREQALAATGGPWFLRDNDLIGGKCVMPVDGPPSSGVAEVSDFGKEADAAYIASWHPAVAFAIADLLDEEAYGEENQRFDASHLAIAVARAYLGEKP